MAAPLAGTRVIELGTMITAPLAGMMLGDLGADVIKVERPGSGDPFRSFEGGSYSPHFVAFNRNKQSLVLDLQAEHDREKLFSLVRTSDVVIDNFRAGVLDRLGLSPERMREINSRIIQCSITGFGTVGPYKDRPAFDTVGQALSGIASLAIDPGAPKFTGTTISDNVTGMYACYAILAALIEREKTGRGRRVEVNMMEASVAFMPDAFVNLETHGIRNGPLTRVSFSQSYVVRCKDGKLLAIHLSSADKFWAALLRSWMTRGLRMNASPRAMTGSANMNCSSTSCSRALNGATAAPGSSAWRPRTCLRSGPADRRSDGRSPASCAWHFPPARVCHRRLDPCHSSARPLRRRTPQCLAEPAAPRPASGPAGSRSLGRKHVGRSIKKASGRVGTSPARGHPFDGRPVFGRWPAAHDCAFPALRIPRDDRLRGSATRTPNRNVVTVAGITILISAKLENRHRRVVIATLPGSSMCQPAFAVR